jgi:CHAT domain
MAKVKHRPLLATFHITLIAEGPIWVAIEARHNCRKLSPSGGHRIRVKDLTDALNTLRVALGDYNRSDKSSGDLHSLATVCRDKYKWFFNNLLHKDWRSDFETCIGQTSQNCRIEFETDSWMFPIQLLYTKDISSRRINPKGFLGLRVQVRTLYANSETRARKHTPGKLSVAFAYCNTLPGYKLELDSFEEALRRGKITTLSRIGPTIKSPEDIKALWLAKSPYHVVHISAHMDVQGAAMEICLSNGVAINPSHFAIMDAPRTVPHLVFLNCCNSDQMAPDISTGFLEIMCQRFSEGCIATTTDVEEGLAARVAVFFYEHFLRNNSVGHSLKEAQLRFATRYQDYSVLSYSLVNLDPDFVLQL